MAPLDCPSLYTVHAQDYTELILCVPCQQLVWLVNFAFGIGIKWLFCLNKKFC